MWLLTAVGPVHGQRHFTVVLEKSRSYKIGRDTANDIRFVSRNVRPKEGTLEVGDWSPTDRSTPPTVIWRPEQKKGGGSYHPAQVLSPIAEAGSIDADEYTVETRENESEVALEHGKGLKLGADSWFTVTWKQLHLSYDKMKNEEEDVTEGLRRCCISWTASFQTNDPAEIVVSATYKSSMDCYFAVTFGKPIVSDQWLHNLSNRLRACWKKIADSQDSFSLPDALDPNFRPTVDPSLRNTSAIPEFWLPRPQNHTLFSGWRVVGLKTAKALTDKRYYVAMGAEWSEIDIANPLITSQQDVLSRIAPFHQQADAENRKLCIMYLPSAKKDLEARGVNFDEMVTAAFDGRSGFWFTSGKVLWQSVLAGGVENYFESKDAAATTAAPTSSGAVDTAAPTSSVPAPTAMPSSLPPASAAPPSSAVPPPTAPPAPVTTTTTGRLTRRAGTTSRGASRAPSARPTEQPDVVPSTFATDLETAAKMEPPKTKKPLKRRAGREPKPDTFEDMDVESTEMSQPSLLFQASHVGDTQMSSGSGSQPSATAMSRVPDSVMDVDVPSAAPSFAPSRPAGRLKRRAGLAATQSSFLGDIDTSVAYAERVEQEEKKAKHRELYEELNRDTITVQPAFKRTRTLDPETQQQQSANRAEAMQVDEENDFVSRALKSARHKRGASPDKSKSKETSPVKEPQRKKARLEREELEEEEVEEPEPELQKKPPPKKPAGKPAAKAVRGPTQVDRDDKFLQAIKTNRKKNLAVDELDQEFNQLRILKPNTKAKAKAVWEPPDYSVLAEVGDDQMRGNFIEIVKTDLFRKDESKETAADADDGRPNFKKFKKKNIIRRLPVTLVLSGPHQQAEMGEPYWQVEKLTQTQSKKTQEQPTQRRRGTGLFIDDDFDDDSVPLAPVRNRRKILTAVDEEDDDDDFTALLPTAKGRRGAAPLTQSQVPFTQTQAQVKEEPATSRRSRATSAVSTRSVGSEVSSAAASSTARRAPARSGRSGGTQGRPLLIDDSDDDNLFTTAPTAPTATATRSSRARGAAAAGTAAKTSTIVPDTGAAATLTRASRSRGTQAAASTSRSAPPRRKLLMDDGDDDDEIEFKGVQKKRRVR